MPTTPDMTPRERLETALDGGTPDLTPLSIYSWMVGDEAAWDQPEWKSLLDQGLALIVHCFPLKHVEHGVTSTHERKVEGSNTYDIWRKETPIGTLQRIQLNGWHYEDYIKTPHDYRIRQWIVEHTEILPDPDTFESLRERVGERGVCVACTSRTPLMSINIDWAGTEQFCMDIASDMEELLSLYEAQRKQFLQEIELVAKGPLRFVKVFENLTLSMIGHERYRDFLLNVYQEAFPRLHQTGKRVFVHYDGALSPIRDQIATAPFDGIESLTEPPEGDMDYAACRHAWPDKVFWANINVQHYYETPEQLRAAVVAKRERAGKRALAFEISEDLPRNWAQSIPVVLDTLRELR